MGKIFRNRNILAQSWLNEEEYNRLLELSAKTGLGRSVVIRRLIMEAELREVPPLEVQAILVELKRIGNNMNQIAAMLNAGLGFSNREYQNNYQHLMEILGLLQERLLGN